MNPIERILAALREHGHKPRKAGTGWACTCPAHNDRSPSLSIGAGDDGRALVTCHAGCAVADVLDAIGLRASDLFADDPTRRSGHAPKPRRRGDGDETPRTQARDQGFVAVATVTKGETFATANAAVTELERRHGKRTAAWTYNDASGDPVAVVVRWNGANGKTIRPVSRTPAGWIIGGMPEPRLLYRLPDLLAMPAGSRVWVVEGEKVADAARAIGMAATTSPHGSKSASRADWSPVVGHHVVILPDHDHAGDGYADDVARLARAAGAQSVRVARLADVWPGIGDGDDLADYVEHRRGQGAADETILAEVEALADAAEPTDPPADASLVFSPFPVDVLPEPIRAFVLEGASAIGCDASFVALPVLVALAAAIGNTRRLALKRGWSEPAILWAAIVGESGTTKSPAIDMALGPIRKRQREAMRRYADAMRRHDDDMAMFERDLREWHKSKSDDLPPAKPVPPVPERCWADDTTVEALAVLLQQNPRGLMVARDELAGWLGSFDRYNGGKGGDVAKWLEMFGGRPIMVDRRAGGVLHVPAAWVSVIGGIQPETLRRALGQEYRDNGLAARLLLAWPPRKPKRWTEADVSPHVEAAVVSVFDRLFTLAPVADDTGEDRPVLLTLDADAKAAWVDFYNRHNRAQADLTGDESAAWSKLEGYAARFALVVHLIRWAADDPILRDPMRVDAATIPAGVALVGWFGDEARRVYRMLAESDDDREGRRLVEWIERKGGTVTARDLARGPREYRDDPERAEKALRDLVAAGVAEWVRDDHKPKGGRPTTRVRLVSRSGDTGDGDESRETPGVPEGFVATVGMPIPATMPTPTTLGEPDDAWGETPGAALGRSIAGE